MAYALPFSGAGALALIESNIASSDGWTPTLGTVLYSHV
jgi:hypothetical protein